MIENNNAEKSKSQATGNWFGNLVNWFIDYVIICLNKFAAFWAKIIGKFRSDKKLS